MAGATLTTLSKVLQSQYAKSLQQQLNNSTFLQAMANSAKPAKPGSKVLVPLQANTQAKKRSLYRQLYGAPSLGKHIAAHKRALEREIFGKVGSFEYALDKSAEELMAKATLTTLSSICENFYAPAVENHRLRDFHLHHRMDADMVTMTCYCEDCKQHFAQNVAMSRLMASKGNLEGIQDFLRHQIQGFFQYIRDRACCDAGNVAAIAEWLTKKLVEHGPLTMAAAGELWKQEHEVEWAADVAEETARTMGFLKDTWEYDLDELLPPLDSTVPVRISVDVPGKLELPADHPLAA